jgi:hypothetical protein
VLRQIIAKHPKARTDPEKLWRIFEAEIHEDRALAAAVLQQVRATWFAEAFREL